MLLLLLFQDAIDVMMSLRSSQSTTSSLTPCFLNFLPASQLKPLQPQPLVRPKRTPQHARCWDHTTCHNPPALTMMEHQGPALKRTATPNSWFHSYIKYPSPQTQTKQGSTCFSRSWVFLLWHSNLGAVRQALRLVWSSLLQALRFTVMLSASKSSTLQAKEFFICFCYMHSSQLSVPDTLIVFWQSSFQLRSASSFLPNFASMLHKI